MAVFVTGHAKTIAGVDEVMVKCPSCEKDSWADLMVETLYFQIYWIPIFPFDKTANIICQECELKRFGLPFTSNLISNYSEIKNRFRHPLYAYSGSVIAGIFIPGIILAIIFNR
jgi:hypothetical protein